MLKPSYHIFCEGIVSGMTRADAYAAAFPFANLLSARSGGSRLFHKPCIQAEIARLRGGALSFTGPAALSNVEIRAFLARIVRATRSAAGEDADLGASGRAARKDDGAISTRDKLLALKLAVQLAPEPLPEQNAELEAFHDIIRSVRSKPWNPGATPGHSQAVETPAAGQPAPEAPATVGPAVSVPEPEGPSGQSQTGETAAAGKAAVKDEVSTTAGDPGDPSAPAASDNAGSGQPPPEASAAARPPAPLPEPEWLQDVALREWQQRQQWQRRPRPSGRYQAVVGKYTGG